MVTVKLIRNTNGGLEYLFRACRYVDNTERAIYINGFGVNPYDLNDAYDQMLGVKRYFGKTSGNPLAHFVISFDESVREPWCAVELGPADCVLFYAKISADVVYPPEASGRFVLSHSHGAEFGQLYGRKDVSLRNTGHKRVRCVCPTGYRMQGVDCV